MLSTSGSAADGPDPIDGLEAALAELLTVDLGLLERDQLLDLLRRFEVFKRRLAVVDHAVVAELDDRGVARELCATSTAALLRGLLRISPREAARRVRAAANLGPRRGLSGSLAPPLFDDVAAAQAAGVISAEHAAVIITTIDKLPGAIAAEREAGLRAQLVEHATDFDPHQLATLARRIVEVLDPDGALTDDADHQRRRELTLSRNYDGSFSLAGHLTPECGARWQPLFDSLARPMPAHDGTPDPRRAPQRMHDAFELIPRLIQPGQLPDRGGLPVTLLLTATVEQVESGTGFATTGHGGLIPIRRAIDLAGEAQTLSVLFDAHGGVLDYGQARRIVPPAMRLAITARDKGCTFPGCDRPPAWTQANHFVEFAAGGSTSIDNCGLVCGYHHREFGRKGWRGEMINGRPHWIPPAWMDRERRPRRNTIHDPPLRT